KEFALVRENLRERQRLLENAPYLVRPLPFLIPLFGRDGVVAKALARGYSVALRLYDLSGGWRIGRRFTRVRKDEALAHLPTLATDRLVAGFLYFDARGDDARVALTLARTAALDHDADVATYVRATGVTRDAAGRVNGVVAIDQLGGRDLTLATRSVVNAAGVWTDQVVEVTSGVASHQVTPAKGVHLSVPASRLPTDVAAVFAVPGDRRSVFVIPFEEAPFTFIGTTDTAYAGPLDDPTCTGEDVDYLLGAVNAWTTSNLAPADVTGLWAGLRPLVAPRGGEALSERTADLSRRHRVTDEHDGVVSVTGGKWTTYRQMAEDTVDALKPYVTALRASRTKRLALHGVGPWRPGSERETHLYRRYGEDARAVLALIAERPSLGEPVIEGLPYLGAEFVYGARHEMATSLVDLLTRRTRAHLQDARATLRAAPAVADLVADEFWWTRQECARQVDLYRDLIEHEFAAAGLALVP
ncbi:MAG: glycerol-3-phosphate dehydrogenase/oxidase, partial [Acidobacteriota bacterium]|nr:glycerol-3-phosphate dehydrogenase/oxidase [Acidobacteriota bacterium]